MKIFGKTILFLLFFIFAFSICNAKTKTEMPTLDRIMAEEGDGSHVKVKLRVGKSARGQLFDMIRDENNKALTNPLRLMLGTLIQKTSKDKEAILVSGGFAEISMDTASLCKRQGNLEPFIKQTIITQGDLSITLSGNGLQLICERIRPYGYSLKVLGEFLVDDSLTFNTLNTGFSMKWDGRKEGALHVLIGKIAMFDYEFDSKIDNPLVFKQLKQGYVFQGGAGTVKDLKSGKVYNLNSRPLEGIEAGDKIDKKSCNTNCTELLKKGQLKEGLTLDECIKELCK